MDVFDIRMWQSISIHGSQGNMKGGVEHLYNLYWTSQTLNLPYIVVKAGKPKMKPDDNFPTHGTSGSHPVMRTDDLTSRVNSDVTLPNIFTGHEFSMQDDVVCLILNLIRWSVRRPTAVLKTVCLSCMSPNAWRSSERTYSSLPSDTFCS